jgi:tryptophan synthase
MRILSSGTLYAKLPNLLARVKKYSGDKPAAVGFDVSTRDHFVSVSQIADGVVTMQKASPGQGPQAVKDFYAYLSGRATTEEETMREVGIVEHTTPANPTAKPTFDAVVTDADGAINSALVTELAALQGKIPDRFRVLADVATRMCRAWRTSSPNWAPKLDGI